MKDKKIPAEPVVPVVEDKVPVVEDKAVPAPGPRKATCLVNGEINLQAGGTRYLVKDREYDLHETLSPGFRLVDAVNPDWFKE